MKKPVAVIVLALFAGCSTMPEKATAIATLDEVRSLAEDFVFRGDFASVRNHTDVSGVPPEKLRQIEDALAGWHGVSGDLRQIETKVMSFSEYEAFQQEDRKGLPEFIRNMPSHIKWNVKPDKIILFTFASKDPKDTTTKVRYSSGAYQRNGSWYFATCYSE